jgi:hypothetical protein
VNRRAFLLAAFATPLAQRIAPAAPCIAMAVDDLVERYMRPAVVAWASEVEISLLSTYTSVARRLIAVPQ